MLRNVCVSQAEPIAACVTQRGSAGNDPVKIAGITLCDHQRLAAAVGAAVEVSMTPGLSVILHRDLLGNLRYAFNRTVSVVDARLLVTGERCVRLRHWRSAGVPGIG